MFCDDVPARDTIAPLKRRASIATPMTTTISNLTSKAAGGVAIMRRGSRASRGSRSSLSALDPNMVQSGNNAVAKKDADVVEVLKNARSRLPEDVHRRKAPKKRVVRPSR